MQKDDPVNTPPMLGTLETAIFADDIDAAAQFYGDVLGLTRVSRVDGRHAFFRTTADPFPQMLLIFNPAATEQPGQPVPSHGARGQGHVCFAVAEETLDAWRRHLIASGVAIETEVEWPKGGRSIYFRDPAGNSVELAPPRIWPS
ncbi:MAG: glyoxalase/bleomycin resistance/extradiol dioxygenase family protein [Paracoccus denitrificans]|nr:MAG: glyoxalase/bleomycin resistance/extradiol dioxygenase family protein [Paracoccus denitrificans]PZO83562.1 MAG: glyoxalase/bleomycin resistance/extradiol dioxygenase family protein [Paracoccus denitrificans]